MWGFITWILFLHSIFSLAKSSDRLHFFNFHHNDETLSQLCGGSLWHFLLKDQWDHVLWIDSYDRLSCSSNTGLHVLPISSIYHFHLHPSPIPIEFFRHVHLHGFEFLVFLRNVFLTVAKVEEINVKIHKQPSNNISLTEDELRRDRKRIPSNQILGNSGYYLHLHTLRSLRFTSSRICPGTHNIMDPVLSSDRWVVMNPPWNMKENLTNLFAKLLHDALTVKMPTLDGRSHQFWARTIEWEVSNPVAT